MPRHYLTFDDDINDWTIRTKQRSLLKRLFGRKDPEGYVPGTVVFPKVKRKKK